MKNLIIILAILVGTCIMAQAQEEIQAQSPKWFFTPEYSAMFHANHTANAVGINIGVSTLNNHLDIAFFYVGRSGPINSQEETYQLPAGETYKGKSQLNLGVDQAAFGFQFAPKLDVAKGKVYLSFPLNLGQMGAGYYLKGNDRITPDGERVSVWENKLLNEKDASFGWLVEGGVRAAFNTKWNGIKPVIGVSYAQVIGWDTEVGGTDYYNIPRVTLGVRFGN